MTSVAVAAIFRNEAPNLREWLDHYFVRGVAHVFLINDGSDDDFRSVLRPFLRSGRLTLLECSLPRDLRGRQDVCYNALLPQLVTKFDWLLLVDVDEFVWDSEGFSLVEFAAGVGDVDVVSVFMDDYGDNGLLEQPSSVVAGFTRRARRPSQTRDPARRKQMLRTSQIRRLAFHSPTVKPGSAPLLSPRLRLNHYKLQSRRRWFEVVVPRGSANATEQLHHRHSPIFFDNIRAVMNYEEDLGLVHQNSLHGTACHPSQPPYC